MRITLKTPSDFRFTTAVCSHGFFMLSPNWWDPTRAVLHTTIETTTGQAVPIRLAEATVRGKKGIRVTTERAAAGNRSRVIRSAVQRVLRLDEDLSCFHVMCRQRSGYELAATTQFGRLIRGASLFEDIVKVMCTCNVTWRQTVAMVDRIVGLWGTPSATGAHGGNSCNAFPGPRPLAEAGAQRLRREARLGYRAEWVSRLAREVADGKLDLNEFEHFEGSTVELKRLLRQIHGVGDYAASNIAMLLGRYDCLAIDTEMMRHLEQRHPRRKWTPKTIAAHYESWHPYEFLAYWYELWSDYREKLGPAEQWSLSDEGTRITSQ